MRDGKPNGINKLALISMIFLILYFLLWLVRIVFLYLFDMNWITINVFENSFEKRNALTIYAIISIVDVVILTIGIMGVGRVHAAKKELVTLKLSERIKALVWPYTTLIIVSMIYLLGSYIQFTQISYSLRLVTYGIELMIVILLYAVFREMSKDLIILEKDYKFKFIQPLMLTTLAIVALIGIIFIPKLIYTIQFWKHQLETPIWELGGTMISIIGLKVSNMLYVIVNGFFGLLSIIQVIYYLAKNKLIRKTDGQDQEEVLLTANS